MKIRNKKILLFLLIFFATFIFIMLWRDLHLDLDEVIDSQPAQPELTIKGISFEREIGDRLWKVTAPQTYKQGQVISATHIDAYVKGKDEQTKINAKLGSYHMLNQVFNFTEAKLISKQKGNNYDISANNLSFEAQKKKWNFKGDVFANSDDITIRTNSAVLLEDEKTCELPNGGSIIWKEKK